MTEPGLLDAVRTLTDAAERNAAELASLREQQENDRLVAVVDRRKSRRTRALAVASLVGWVLDIALSIFAVVAITVLLHFRNQQHDFNARQDCAAHRTEAFLSAEHDKVSGQKAGWKVEGQGVALQHHGVTEILGNHVRVGLDTYSRGVAMQQQGLAQVQSASTHYLDVIGGLAAQYQC